MKAAVCYEFGQPLRVEEIVMEQLGGGQALVKVDTCAICGSDVHTVKGEHWPAPLPGLGGHEVAGVVEAVGGGVTYVKPGDHVVCCLVRAGCGQCASCISGAPYLCENRGYAFNQPGPYLTGDGRRLTLFPGFYAGFQEYTSVPEECLVKIPEDMPLDRAALLGCGFISGFGAVLNKARVRPNQSVLVVGAGGVGLSAIQGAAFSGAYPIIAQDAVDRKLEAARAFGATHTINVRSDPDPAATIKTITRGRGVDFALICVAGIKVKREAFQALAREGTEIFIGHGFAEWMADWDAVELVGGRTITGCAMGNTRIKIDIPRYVELYQAGRIKLDEMISGRYRLDQINEAIAATASGESLRNVIIF